MPVTSPYLFRVSQAQKNKRFLYGIGKFILTTHPHRTPTPLRCSEIVAKMT
jgi:hypothetical protein